MELLRFAIPLIIGLVFLITLLTNAFNDFFFQSLLFTIISVLVIFSLGIIFVLVLLENQRIRTTKYVVDKNNIHAIGSLFGTSHVTRKVSSITSMEVKQSLFGKALGYGDIEIGFFGGGTMRMENISNPGETLNRIQRFIEEDE